MSWLDDERRYRVEQSAKRKPSRAAEAYGVLKHDLGWNSKNFADVESYEQRNSLGTERKQLAVDLLANAYDAQIAHRFSEK